VIGVDAIAIRKGHPSRIVGSALARRRPLWCGGKARSEERRDACSQWLGPSKSQQIRLAVLDRWQAFRHATRKPEPAPPAAILFDKFPGIRPLGTAVDTGRQTDYDRLTGQERRFINGQQYTRLSHREHLKPDGRKSLRRRLQANRRLHTASRLQEEVGKLWDDECEGWARRCFEHWQASLQWQRLTPYEKFAERIDRHWDGSAASCQPEHTVA